ncbi:tRNA (adenosine(37)-N6)-dimethylallyltransferase MiaA [Pseudogracilibacillus sp. SO30301A]|uniref:tRNA (adenosine(37)-N6)-dimethylallyltransferase MiaA n=1 Tax=Pseudogracilibacillus sp. SO30301A TaxID=3098291 RepID=UPI00300DD00A
MKNVIVIVGPTAVGKTKLSIDLAKCFHAEIISGDSMQVYKGLDIGTGKITEQEKNGIPHFMLDIKEPDESFSAAEYQTLVQKHIEKINDREKVPILVGGSGLYIQSVLYDYNFNNRKRDNQKTKKLEQRLQAEGNQALYEELKQIDHEQAKKIHPNNYRRVIRALEIYETTGLTMTEIHQQQKNSPRYNHIIIGLEMDRKTLYNQINKRVDQMVAEGLIEEVTFLYNKGYENCQSMKAIGYKEIIPYVKGEVDFNIAVETLKRNSRRYAKRQYTWFKNQLDIEWFQTDIYNNTPFQSIVHTIENAITKKYSIPC